MTGPIIRPGSISVNLTTGATDQDFIGIGDASDLPDLSGIYATVASVTTNTSAIAALPSTYGRIWATPTASTTLTGTLAAWTVTSVDCTAGAGARSLPPASSVLAGTAFVAKKGDTSTNAL